jgi:hypothetical protein
MSRSHKLIYDFPRQLCLEISYDNIEWSRVTCETFRAFKGARRVQGEPYDGKTYYKGTNYIHRGKVKAPRVIQITELNDKVKKRHRQEAAMARSVVKPNTKFLNKDADNTINNNILCSSDTSLVAD